MRKFPFCLFILLFVCEAYGKEFIFDKINVHCNCKNNLPEIVRIDPNWIQIHGVEPPPEEVPVVQGYFDLAK